MIAMTSNAVFGVLSSAVEKSEVCKIVMILFSMASAVAEVVVFEAVGSVLKVIVEGSLMNSYSFDDAVGDCGNFMRQNKASKFDLFATIGIGVGELCAVRL